MSNDRPDVAYAKIHGEWSEHVDALNDKFNYTLGLPMAKALASRIPGALVVDFPLPDSWPSAARRESDKRRFAFAWLRQRNEELSGSSRILTVSGEMSAGDWLEQEAMRLDEATVSAPPSDFNACHRVLWSIASRLPWMPVGLSTWDRPWGWLEMNDVLEEVQQILSLPSSSLSFENCATRKHWESLATQRIFAFEAEKEALERRTSQVRSMPRARRV